MNVLLEAHQIRVTVALCSECVNVGEDMQTMQETCFDDGVGMSADCMPVNSL